MSVAIVLPGVGATVWDPTTGETIQEFRDNRVIDDGLSESVWTRDVRFTEDGEHLIVVSHNGRGIHKMSIETGKRLWSFFLMARGDQAVCMPEGGEAITDSRNLIRHRRSGSNVLLKDR
jgi:hypothetical protein